MREIYHIVKTREMPTPRETRRIARVPRATGIYTRTAMGWYGAAAARKGGE